MKEREKEKKTEEFGEESLVKATEQVQRIFPDAKTRISKKKSRSLKKNGGCLDYGEGENGVELLAVKVGP